jgi:RNA polymerase-binding transcription factor DksA
MSKKQSKNKGGKAKKTVKKAAKPTAKKAVKPAKKVVKKAAVKKKASPAKVKIIKKASPKAAKPVKKAKAAAKKVVKKIARPAAKPAKKIAKAVKPAVKKSGPVQKKMSETIIPTHKEVQMSMFQNNNARKAAKNIQENMSKDERTRYSDEELKEFEVLISDKLDKAKKELTYIKEALSKKNDTGTDTTGGTLKLLEDGADTAEKENFTQLAARQQKFIQQLENALARIKNGTYGICVDTGKLIPKERLRAVPHTQHSIEAKLNRKD